MRYALLHRTHRLFAYLMRSRAATRIATSAAWLASRCWIPTLWCWTLHLIKKVLLVVPRYYLWFFSAVFLLIREELCFLLPWCYFFQCWTESRLFNLLVPCFPLDCSRILASLLLLRGLDPGHAAKIIVIFSVIALAGVVVLSVPQI